MEHMRRIAYETVLRACGFGSLGKDKSRIGIKRPPNGRCGSPCCGGTWFGFSSSPRVTSLRDSSGTVIAASVVLTSQSRMAT